MVKPDPDDENSSKKSTTDKYSVNDEKQNLEFKEAFNFIFHHLLDEIPPENPGDDIYFHLPESNQNNNMEHTIILLGKKTKRNDCLQKFKNLNLKDSPYRFDYFIKLFKGYFLLYVKITLNDLVDNCKFGKKFGKINFHSPCRDKYAGNSNEESNSIFIGLTIEEVFTDVGTTFQLKNKEYVNKIRKKFKELSSKPNKNEKENEQYEAIKILMDYLGTKINKALDQYYDSEEFGEFRSDTTIKKYNNKFYKERNRNFYLLDKNNYVRLFKKEKKNN